LSITTTVDKLEEALNRLEEIEGFQAIRALGFIDALTPEGRQIVFDLASGRPFANECQLCLFAMREGEARLWRNDTEVFAWDPHFT
jgi:hypothetical protein